MLTYAETISILGAQSYNAYMGGGDPRLDEIGIVATIYNVMYDDVFLDVKNKRSKLLKEHYDRVANRNSHES